MAFNVKGNVSWVGKVDWELRKFHGNEYSTHRGSTYNSYLVEEEKTVLIDTVWIPFAKEFVRNLERKIDLKRIDYVVANHAECDHSGALPELLERIPDVPVYCSGNGVKSLKGHYHKDWNFQVVKTGDRLPLGDKELVFIEAPMLHWPDSMFCYLTGDNILFSYSENQVALLYDTMWNGTRTMAESIAKGMAAGSPSLEVKVFNIAKSDKNDIITEVFKSKAIGVGSSTINRGILTSAAAILEEIAGLKFKNKKAFAFGCYGWSGDSVGIISDRLESSGFELMDEGIRNLWNPDDQGIERCFEYGRKIASGL